MSNKNRFFNFLPHTKSYEAPKNIVNESRTEATIYLYDEINHWWSGAEWLKDVLNSMLDVPEIHLRINSPGGDIFEAKAMQMNLVQHPAHITAHIDGLAASAASFLIRGANKRVIADGGFLMIHQAQSGLWGSAQDFASRGEALQKIDSSLLEHYMKVSGENVDQVWEWIKNETWFSAKEALEHKFVDEIVEAEPVKNMFDLTNTYKNVPEALKNKQPTEPAPPTNKYDMDAIAREILLAEAFY